MTVNAPALKYYFEEMPVCMSETCCGSQRADCVKFCDCLNLLNYSLIYHMFPKSCLRIKTWFQASTQN